MKEEHEIKEEKTNRDSETDIDFQRKGSIHTQCWRHDGLESRHV